MYVIVPYRDTTQPERRAQLHTLLQCFQQNLPEARLLVVEQGCDRPFNSGALQNIGVQLAGARDSDSVCMQDVDMLPHADLLPDYTRELPATTVRHLAGAWGRYTHASFLGGVVMCQQGVFRAVNGYPNDFWGWGGHDDELRDRLVRHGLAVEKCTGGITDMENNGAGLTRNQKHKHLKRTEQKCPNKRELRRWHRAHPCAQGLAQVKWRMLHVSQVYDNCTRFRVRIEA